MLEAVRFNLGRLLERDGSPLVGGAVVALLTLVAAWAGNAIWAPGHSAPIIWPASGVAIATILVTSGPNRAASLVGALLGILAWAVFSSHDVVSCVLIVAAHAAQFVLIERLTHYWSAATCDFASLRGVLVWLATILAGAAVGGALMVIDLIWEGAAGESLGRAYGIVFAAHAVGIILIVPLVLAFAEEFQRRTLSDDRFAEGICILSLTFVFSVVLLYQTTAYGALARTAPLAVFFPLLLWASVRCRRLCSAQAALIVAAATLAGLVDGRGPFSDAAYPVQDNVLSAQVFISSTVVCALILSAIMAERRRSQQHLSEALQRNALALAAGETGTWSYDPKSGIVDADGRARMIWGLDPDGSLTDTILDRLVHPDDREIRKKRLLEAQNPAGAGQLEMEYRLSATSDTPERWVVVRGRAEFVAGRAQLMFGTIRDITARRRAEAVLARDRKALEELVAERTGQLQAMLDSAVSAIVSIDQRGAIQSVNTSAIRLFGYDRSELLGQNVRKLMPEPDASRHDGYIKAYLDTGQRRIIDKGREVEARRKDGSTFPIHLAVSEFPVAGHLHFTGIITDLTEHKSAQEQLRQTERMLAQAQKMEAIGRLTGGIAHDFNNLLTVITGNLELLDMQLQDDDARDLVRRAEDAARRGARLTERLSTFSRRRALQPVVVDLNETAIGMTELTRRALGEQVTVGTNLAPGLWRTRVDPGEIENAILNLAINARDAMPEGGRIVLETSNVVLGEADTAGLSEAKPGEYARLSVTDTGHGMPPEVAERAVEPFFTTKEPGKGTGLGLSTIYGFLRQSGGCMKIESAPGQGTTVSLYLPRDLSGAEPAAPPSDVAAAQSPLGEWVLVVEDNVEVRHLAVRQLQLLGYRTMEAADGLAALAILRGQEHVDLLFSDVIMPGGLTGFELAREARKLRPGLPILLASGFAPEERSDDKDADQAGDATKDVQGAAFDAEEMPPLLKKPYTRTALATAVSAALNG